MIEVDIKNLEKNLNNIIIINMDSNDIFKRVADFFKDIHLIRNQNIIIREILRLISKFCNLSYIFFLPLKNNPRRIVYQYYLDNDEIFEEEGLVKLYSKKILDILRDKNTFLWSYKDIKKDKIFSKDIPFSNKLLFLPVNLGNDILGIFIIFKDEFMDIEIENLKLLSYIIAYVISESNMFDTLNRLISNLKISYDISKVMIEEMNTEEFINKILKTLREHFGYDIISIFLLSKDKKFSILEYIYDEKYKDLKGLKINLDKKCIINYVVKNEVPYYCPDTSKDPIYFDEIEGIYSEFAVPLKIKDKIIGVLDIESKKKDDFPITIRNLIESFAALIAISIENKRLYEETKRLSRFDELTGLLNRRTLEEEIKKEFLNCINKKIDLGLFFIDLDNFKNFNDKYGHLKGDKILRNFGNSLKRKFKDAICGRYGGDEFLCFFKNKNKTELINSAKKILNEFKNEKRYKNIRASIGISLLTDEIKTVEQLINEADKKCYISKRNGGNTYKI